MSYTLTYQVRPLGGNAASAVDEAPTESRGMDKLRQVAARYPDKKWCLVQVLHEERTLFRSPGAMARTGNADH